MKTDHTTGIMPSTFGMLAGAAILAAFTPLILAIRFLSVGVQPHSPGSRMRWSEDALFTMEEDDGGSVDPHHPKQLMVLQGSGRGRGSVARPKGHLYLVQK